MLYSFYIYIKDKFFVKKPLIQKIDSNHSVILNLGYLPDDGTIV